MRISDQEFNRLTVLKRLRAAEPVSRTELAALSGLNGGTITTIVRDLVDRGLVIEQRMASTGRGRPKVNLRIDPNAAFVAGATLTGHGSIEGEIVDLRGESVFSFRHVPPQSTRLDELAHRFADVVAEAIAAAPVGKEQISQVGIGLPAIVDRNRGIVEFLETFDDGPSPFAAIVEQRLGITTWIDNNINLLARAEHWFGDADVEDFTVVFLGLGLGAARYQAGQLLIGAHGIEAEFGHTKIVPEGGRPCHCGAFGCLQAYSAVSGMIQQWSEERGEESPPHYRMNRIFETMVVQAQAGDPGVLDILSRAARYLGRGLANHINMQDPERIVLLAENEALVPLIADQFFAALDQDTLPVLRRRARVTFKNMDNASYARGAAAMVLERLYRAVE
jgi:predicted NBD/HSP70 family sugar kinase